MICNVKKEKKFFLNSMEMVFRGGGFSPCIQSHHKTEGACMGFRFREGGVGGGEGERIVQIGNGGSWLTSHLCRILVRNTTRRVVIVGAISTECRPSTRRAIPLKTSIYTFGSSTQCEQSSRVRVSL